LQTLLFECIYCSNHAFTNIYDFPEIFWLSPHSSSPSSSSSVVVPSTSPSTTTSISSSISSSSSPSSSASPSPLCFYRRKNH
ncbi:hypothetical protein PMAYCL1PPCAC_15301, partial [Pristionchus mayeri]